MGYSGEMGLVEKRSMIELGDDGLRATAILTGDSLNRILIYSWYKGVASAGKEILHALLALDQSPFRRAEAALVMRVTTAVASTPEGVEQADERLRDFLTDLKNSRAEFCCIQKERAEHPVRPFS